MEPLWVWELFNEDMMNAVLELCLLKVISSIISRFFDDEFTRCMK